ncbi:MAG TPA: peptidoglycan DD-metalloendopeptidase family protein [Bacteroidota bacterium]|nr:peptidoglycan DD-metalloendopeptidase family protein [Bacteroidota bacterium]
MRAPRIAYAFSVVLIATLSTALSGTPSAQTEISKRQKELQSIRDQIAAMEEKMKDQSKKEKVSLDLLDTYDRNATLLRRLISRLKADEQDLQLRIDTSRTTIERLQQHYDFLRDEYSRYVVSVYKAGRVHDLELLLSSSSINQFAIRNEYLKRFSRQRKQDADAIARRKHDLEQVEVRLQLQLGDQRRVIEEKGNEQARLASLAEDRRKMITQIRHDRKLLQQSLERQNRAAKDLEDMITQLIEAEKIKKQHLAESSAHERLPQPAGAGNFAARRGHLRWPVAEGSIVAQFGAQRHPTLKTVTLNPGIDIAVKPGTAVTAVADGEVARIWWLPSFGNLMIIDHSGGYRTVYTHLEDIKVLEGQNVKEGEVIAESGESVDGPRIHFEIWKDQEKQNPQLWLARQ